MQTFVKDVLARTKFVVTGVKRSMLSVVGALAMAAGAARTAGTASSVTGALADYIFHY